MPSLPQFSMKTKVLVSLAVLAAVILLPLIYVTIGGITYSDGERTGVITKFSHKGLIMKTWEGELSMGGLDQGGMPNVWNFSVDDPAVVAELQVAQRKGGRWSLHYRQQLMQQSWKGDTEYFVIGIQKAE